METFRFSNFSVSFCQLGMVVGFCCLWLIGYRFGHCCCTVCVSLLHYFHFFRTATKAGDFFSHFLAESGSNLAFMQQLKQSNCFMAAIVASSWGRLAICGLQVFTGNISNKNSRQQLLRKINKIVKNQLSGKVTITGVPAVAI